jgi:hypothetical protein
VSKRVASTKEQSKRLGGSLLRFGHAYVLKVFVSCAAAANAAGPLDSADVVARYLNRFTIVRQEWVDVERRVSTTKLWSKPRTRPASMSRSLRAPDFSPCAEQELTTVIERCAVPRGSGGEGAVSARLLGGLASYGLCSSETTLGPHVMCDGERSARL